MKALYLFITQCLWILSVSALRQKRAWIIDTFDIEEEKPGPYPFQLGKIHIETKYRLQFYLHGSGVDEEPKGILKINKLTGVIEVFGKLDYETHKLLKLTFEAKNVSNDAIDTKLGVEINIKDINDNAPLFERQIYEVTVEESMAQGTSIVAVRASDLDDHQTENGTFGFRISSVTPATPDLEFYIEQFTDAGVIKFKGCLDYEKAQKYTLLVEVKDKGKVVQLSSTCTVIINVHDNNNHLPIFTGQTGPGGVKERESGVDVLRLQVKDRDQFGTKSWKAKYVIHGDEAKNFNIHTDPETNEGVLTLEKPLDYEDAALRNLTITVENDEPYFSCELKGRPNQGPWNVVMIGGSSKTGAVPPPDSRLVTVSVEDENDPPVFKPEVKHVTLEENSAVGTFLTTFSAVDLDGSYANTFQYQKGEDPAGWVNVDSKSCRITTAQILDRESLYVNSSVYVVTLYAVDNGVPPMTGTGTLSIHLRDQNDNVPTLDRSILDMCLSDGPSVGNLTAHDLDLPPYSGPFQFKLLGEDLEGRWRLNPDYGTTVTLVKEAMVPSGEYVLLLEISDMQGHSSLQNVTVTVCDCSVNPNCHVRRVTGSRIGMGAFGIMFLALLVLLGLILMALFLSCKKEKKPVPEVESSEEYLITSNTETPGTDCEVPIHQVPNEIQIPSQIADKVDGQWVNGFGGSVVTERERRISEGGGAEPTDSWRNNWMRSSLRSSQRSSHYRDLRRKYSFRRVDLTSILHQRLTSLKKPQQELCDYEPHPYTYEGEPGFDLHLEPIDIPESPFLSDSLLNLSPRFHTLASISRPDLVPA